MSKPPSKSGGAGRGRPPGGSSRDGAFSGRSSRGGPSRGGPSREGRAGASRDSAPRGRDRSGDAPRGGRGQDGERRQEGERRGGGYRAGPAREGARDTAPREGGYRQGPRHERLRDERPRDERPRAAEGERGPRRPARDRGTEDRYGGQRRSQGPGSPHSTTRSTARPGPAPRAAAPTPKDPTLPAREGERIAKLLARAGVASRREVERMIAEGRVKQGDQVIDAPSTVLTSLAGITVDGTPVRDPEATRLFLFHKPAGLITAERDPAGRPTIYTALRNALPENAGRVMPIGRLDLSTEGLLLLTNDGAFKRQLELPATGVPRTYRARTFGDITQARLEELMEGIEVDGVIYGRIDANMERRTGRNQWIEMTLTEGKNREVRRVLEALGLQVSRLIRVAYGPFRLGDLPKGAAGEISQRDLDNFRRTLPEGAA
ncbi:pseudouridine synthase [Novosphingobium soli]|uniref:Pseudouridine synthase n=1 Tax=Novosphingobium soli TaxID=574956 RepID=A0ABV6CQF2_9SPHN